jgi:hypothetical protein
MAPTCKLAGVPVAIGIDAEYWASPESLEVLRTVV